MSIVYESSAFHYWKEANRCRHAQRLAVRLEAEAALATQAAVTPYPVLRERILNHLQVVIGDRYIPGCMR